MVVFHFQLTEPLGRVVHLQPVCWMENWPVIGVDMDMNGIGEPVKVWTKPGVSKSVLVSHPQTTDDFNSYTLGLQWQFNHNPVNTHWSLNERRGWLALKALKAATLRESRNMLTQKCMGYLSTATVLLDFQHWLMDKEVDCSAQAVFITELALVVRKVKIICI